MLTKEVMLLLDILSGKEYVTASDLAEKAGCSSKTVRSRMKELNEALSRIPGSPAWVESKPRYGFRMVHGQGIDIKTLPQLLGAEEAKSMPATPGERVKFLLFHLLERKSYITISELAEQLYVSDGVVKTALKNTERILDQYGIHIARRPGYGILAVGDETNIRTCLVDMFMDEDSKIGVSYDMRQKEMEELVQIVAGLMKEHNVSIPEISFYNFVKYIYVSIKRIQHGMEVHFQSESQVQIDESNITFVNNLDDKIRDYFDINISDNEKEYLAIQLAGKRVIGNNGEGNLVFKEELSSLVSQMMEITFEEFNLDLRGNLDLIMLLNQHMIPLDIRLKYNIPQVNPLLEDIQKNYPFAYTIAERTAVILQEYYGREVPEDEIGYLAIIFALGLEEQKPVVEPSNILIVCSSGKGSSRLLTYKYRQEFGEYIDQIKICNLFELGQINFDDIDYVFTTVPIEAPVPVPVYEVSLFLNGEDIIHVRKILEKGNDGFLKTYFAKELFFPKIGGLTKEEVIRELCQRGREVLELPEKFEESVLYREELSSTDYGNMAAIPHPYKAMGTETVVIVGILEEPVFWGRGEVQVVFLISIGSREDRNLQRFYQEVMRLLMNQDTIREFIKEKDLDAFLSGI